MAMMSYCHNWSSSLIFSIKVVLPIEFIDHKHLYMITFEVTRIMLDVLDPTFYFSQICFEDQSFKRME